MSPVDGRSALIGAALVGVLLTAVGLGYAYGSSDDGQQSQLGPQAAEPDPGGRALLAPTQVIEVRLQPFEETFLDFPTGNAGEGCSNVECVVVFTWSVRTPHPSSKPTVELFQERQGAHLSIAAADRGEAAKGYFDPVSVANRSAVPALVEIRYMLTGER